MIDESTIYWTVDLKSILIGSALAAGCFFLGVRRWRPSKEVHMSDAGRFLFRAIVIFAISAAATAVWRFVEAPMPSYPMPTCPWEPPDGPGPEPCPCPGPGPCPTCPRPPDMPLHAGQLPALPAKPMPAKGN